MLILAGVLTFEQVSSVLDKALLPGLLERAHGKGGGSPDLIQVAAADASAAEEAWRWTGVEVPSRVGG